MTPTSAPLRTGSLLERGPATAAEWRDPTVPDASVERDDVVALLKAEMRAPLLALQALRTTLDEGGLSPELDRRMIQHTKTLARRLSLLLEDLVLVTGREDERLVLETHDLRLSTQVARAAGLFPDLSVAIEGDDEIAVRADSLRLQQLLANLIRRADREGTRPIRLQVSCQDETVLIALPGSSASGGHELDIIRRLVLAHGGLVGHDRDQHALLVTLPRARHSRR